VAEGSALQTAENATKPCEVPWARLRLPPFPQVALRVLHLAGEENVQLHQLSELISSDPALASEVLTIVNSLVYAPRCPITSVLQAIAVMGANHLQGLCLTAAVRSYMGDLLSTPVMRTLWLHNLASATIAEQLASAGFMDRDVAFTYGIMHEIGRFALAAVRPKNYGELLATYVGPASGILEREKEVFGKDHCEIGKLLVEEWKLPEEFETIVSGHHDEFATTGTWDLPDLIHASCNLADSAGFPAFAGCLSSPFCESAERLPPCERKFISRGVENLAQEISRKIKAIESI
jgi:HD-like signal output (HDOD) protein